jgi:hypothetical protein
MKPRTLVLATVAAVVAALVGVAVYAVASSQGPVAMSGVVVKAGNASVSAVDQLGAHDSIVVARVTAPGESWVVAYRIGMEGMPGALLGYAHVGAGTTTDVSVPIDPTIRLTPYAIITLNADRGVPGRFEFDMRRFEASPDKPYYVAGQAVQTTITVALPENGDTFEIPAVPAPAQ